MRFSSLQKFCPQIFHMATLRTFLGQMRLTKHRASTLCQPAGIRQKSDSLTEYLPSHIIILKNLTEQVGMNKKQKGDELVLLADPL